MNSSANPPLRGYRGVSSHGDMLRHAGRAERVQEPLLRGYGGVVARAGVIVGPGRNGRLRVRDGIAWMSVESETTL